MPKQEFFDLVTARWKLAIEAEQEQRQKELEDLRFEAGEHWKADVKAERERLGKPCLVIDLLGPPIKQVTNQQRTARPGIKISPVGQGADPKKAERWQGIVRRVERLSQAQRAYSWAGQHQVKMGRGTWMLRNIEVGEDGEQDIRIKAVDNQFTAYCDPTGKELDGSDKKWAFLVEDLTHQEYIDRFGESKLAESLQNGLFKGGIGDSPPEWLTGTHTRIAEHYYVEETKRVRLILSVLRPDGRKAREHVWEDELPTERTRKAGKFASQPKLPDGAEVLRRVKKTTKRVHWCLLNALGEKLDESTIPGEFIPIVQVWGERRNIDGQVDYRGLVRMAKSPSYMEDWAESSLMEAISEAKTAPWLAEWGQIEEFRSIWESRAPVRVLPYRRVSAENQAALPPPQRVTATVDVSALTLAAQRMQNHVRTTTGVPDTFSTETAGQQGKLSGRAILARQSQQELGTSDYLENLGDGIVLTAKIIMSMARDGVYDTPRLMRIWGEDEKEHEVVTYAGQDQRESAMQLMTKEVEEAFDVSVGEYDVAISVGRSYQTARQETVEMLSDLIPQLPPEYQIKALPILFKNMDGAGAMELANAFDPQQGPDPKQMQQQLEQAKQLLEMADGKIKELEQEKATEAQKTQMKGLLEAFKTQLKGEIDAALQQMKGQQAIELQQIKGRWEMAKQDDQQAHEVGLKSAEAAHQAEQARQAAERQSEMAESTDTRQAMMSDLDRQHQEKMAKQKPNGSGQ